MPVDDYKAKFLLDAEIQALAASWRKLLNRHLLSNCLDIPALLKAVGEAMHWPLKVELRPDETMGRANAFVAQGGATVYLRHSLVDAAAAGHSEAVFDGIHELAHIVLHRKVQAPLARMASRDNQAHFLQSEESAEHQANVFARAFLMTDEEVARYPTSEALAENCFVLPQQAVLRLAEYDRTTGRRLRKEKWDQTAREITEARLQGYEPLPCPECRNRTLVRSGTCTTCATCGDTTGC